MPRQPGDVRPLRPGAAYKREAIERAALALFVRDGFARTSVDAVATAAGVSKRTVYDYYGDKNRLFLEVLEQTQLRLRAQFMHLLVRTLGGELSDPQAALTAFGRELAAVVAYSQDRAAVLRLIVTEAPHFPILAEQWRTPGPERRALAERLTALATRGVLELPDPLEAAMHLDVLVTTVVHHRTLFGSVPIPDDELEQLVSSGVRVFLRAYRPARSAPAVLLRDDDGLGQQVPDALPTTGPQHADESYEVEQR